MFRCMCCGEQRPPFEKETRVVSEFRSKTYYDKHGRVEGEGQEIVSEVVLGQCCVEEEQL